MSNKNDQEGEPHILKNLPEGKSFLETWILDETSVAFRKWRDDDDDKKSDDLYGPRVDLRGDQDVFWCYLDDDSGTMERLSGIAGRQIECGYQWIKDHDYEVHPALQSGVNATEGVYEDLLDRYKLSYRVCPAVGKDKQHISVLQINARTGYQQLLKRCPSEPFCSQPIDFQVFLALHDEEKGRRGVDLIALAGSTPNGEAWENAVFSLDLDACLGSIFSNARMKTLFVLEPRGGGGGRLGDYDSVVVLASDDICRHLRRVETNAQSFVNRPLSVPWEDDCESESRMIEYAEMMCENGLCLLAAATTTRCYFGRAFDRMFRSYKYFCDSIISTRGGRLKHAITDENELCRVAGDLMARYNDTTNSDRIYYYVFGGGDPGGFENALGEMSAMDYARRYTRIHEGSLVVTVFPGDPMARVRVFQHGQYQKFRMDQLREATWEFCRLQTGSVINGWEVLVVYRFLGGDCVSYGVRRLGSDDDRLEIKNICDLCSSL